MKRIQKLLARTPYAILNRRRRGISSRDDLAYFLKGRAAPVVFDVGANDGASALSFREYLPAAIIHCFEPHRGTYERLAQCIATSPNTHAHHQAMGSEAREMTLYPQGFSEWNSLVVEINRPAADLPAEQVRVDTVDGFCERARIPAIDLLKTDTEGFDLEVLRGAERMLANGNIDLVFSEVGLRRSDARHTLLSSVMKFLEPHGYYLFALYDLPWRDAASEAEYGNALFVRESGHARAQM